MPKPFYAEQAVVIDGETLRLAINFRAIDATEQLMKPLGFSGYDEILEEIQKPSCPVGVTGRVVWGLLREHHPELSLDETASLLFGANALKVGIALNELLQAAFPTAEIAKGENPPKPRGASKPSGNGGARKTG